MAPEPVGPKACRRPKGLIPGLTKNLLTILHFTSYIKHQKTMLCVKLNTSSLLRTLLTSLVLVVCVTSDTTMSSTAKGSCSRPPTSTSPECSSPSKAARRKSSTVAPLGCYTTTPFNPRPQPNGRAKSSKMYWKTCAINSPRPRYWAYRSMTNTSSE